MFGDFLRELRVMKKLKQKEIAKLLDIGEATYCRIETNKGNLSLPDLQKLAKFYNMSLDKLVGMDCQLNEEKIPYAPLFYSYDPGMSFEKQKPVRYEPLPGYINSAYEYFFITMPDNSLSPQIEKDDNLLLRRTNDMVESCIGLFVAKQQAVFAYCFMCNDEVVLLPTNFRKYEKQSYKVNEVSIIGEVVSFSRILAQETLQPWLRIPKNNIVT
ncbi:MAG: helix-turn-helix transcriptional regulator [Patescibacteria group bacterium]|jgi:transcriptional regulator with XRE-family HTH domain